MSTCADRILALGESPGEPSQQLVDLLSAGLRLYPSDLCPLCAGKGCRTCGQTGAIRLRPIQAQALRDLATNRGLVANIPVGGGKTLVTLLAPTMLAAQRPVLLIPAQLHEQTRQAFAELRKAWRVRLPRLINYELLSSPGGVAELEQANPDLLLLDEAHKLRNLASARTRRAMRFIVQAQPTIAVLSGTLITRNLLDFWHLTLWGLKDNAPVPFDHNDARAWAEALETPWACKPSARAAVHKFGGRYFDHYRSRAGVLTTEAASCSATIEIQTHQPQLPAELAQLAELAELSGMRPDGELLDERQVGDCLQQLSLGLYLRWDPHPPDWWLDPRRAWFTWARAVLDEHLPGFDSLSLIRDGVLRLTPQLIPARAEGLRLWEAWQAVENKFVPNSVPVWISREPLRQAVELAGERSLVWYRWRETGRGTGLPLFGSGTSPQTHPREESIAVSIAAHGTGKNLQQWSRNFLLTLPANSVQWEQLIGRTHRAGQRSGLVTVDLWAPLKYQRDLLARVREQSKADGLACGTKQKLEIANWKGKSQ